MPNYIEENKELEVPPATGVPGFLRVVESILERPRVQRVVIEKGKISYSRFRRDDETEAPLGIELATLMPSAVIRSCSIVEEIKALADNAAIGMAQLFSKAHMDGMNPVALVGGLSSLFFVWHTRTTSVVLAKDECYGLPFLADPEIPDESLILCAAYDKRAALPDTVRCYKMLVPLMRKAKT